ncbi:MAG TPA: DNA repair protein RecO [Steroidobacteraceae bacterium]|nr:DNA repair protein RecO [Steroidobacteraceae bacterium]
MPRNAGRILLAPAYLLHHAPWRDSSRRLELITREHGRVTLFARGVRRPASGLRAVLQPFQRMLVSWSGRGEAGTLIGAELDGEPTSLPPARLMSGFYLNELLLKLFERQDAHPHVFDDYARALERLRGIEAEARTLRIFEKRLLDSLGYGLDLARECESGAALDPRGHYHVRIERGVTRAVEESAATYCGASLASLASEDLGDEQSLRDARRLLREALGACLDGRNLKSREVMRSMQRSSRE